jgi:hypothetical protein
MEKRQIIQPILWIEWPTGAVMGAGALWPMVCSYVGAFAFRATPSLCHHQFHQSLLIEVGTHHE